MNKQVELIHAAFDDAQDFLIREAEKFEAVTTVTTEEKEYVKNMKKAGFVNSEKVLEIEKRMQDIHKSTRLSRLVLHYKKTYPFLKFLTVPQLEDICEKFNLIYAPVANYKGEVPEKNLKEIMDAQPLKEDDKPKNQIVQSRGRGFSTTRTTMKEGLFIAAPASDFDLDGLTKKGVRGFFQTIVKREPDDPIVFRYVFGGLQVLSKWGPEAMDPKLANELDN